MILLDTSALVCGVMRQAGSDRLESILRSASLVAVGSAQLLEAAMVLSGRTSDARFALNRLLLQSAAEILEFREEHATAAMSAFLRFGKGRHPAALNFGDCMTYGLAKVTGLRLIYTGNDFGQTDLTNLERLDDPAGLA